MGKILISQANHLEAAGVEISTEAPVATGDLALGNVATRLLSEAARILATTFSVVIDLGRNRSIGLVALQAHSGTRTGRWQVYGWRDGTSGASVGGEALLDENDQELTDEADQALTDEAATVGATELDSGLLYLWDRTVAWGSRPWGEWPWDGREVVAGGNTALFVPAATPFVRYIRIDIDDQENAVGFVDIGRILIDAPWRPTRNLQVGYSPAPIDESPVEYARNGQAWVDRRATGRTLRFSLAGLRKGEALPLVGDRMQGEGKAVPLFVVVDPDDEVNRHRETFYGWPLEIPAPINNRLHWSASFTMRTHPQ